MAEDWISTNEAAKLSGYHPDYIRKRVRSGRIKGKKFLTLTLVSKTDLLKYIKAQSERGEKRGRKSSV